MSGIPLKTPKIYDSGDTEDINEVIDYLFEEYCFDQKQKRQTKHITAVGVSLGAALLANYAARKGAKNPLTA